MEAVSSPSTCLSLDLLSPSNSVVSSSWPNSCNSSPKRGFAANSSSSCPSSPKRFHFQWDDPAVAAATNAAVDCTLSLGNAHTRSRSRSDPSDVPNRLSRAGSPISEPTKTIDPAKLAVTAVASSSSPPPYQQSQHWATRINAIANNNNSNDLFLQQQRNFSADAAARSIAAAARFATAASSNSSKDFYARHPVLNSHFPTFSTSQELNKYGFLEYHSSFVKSSAAEPCSSRSRFRGMDAHIDPRNVPRICAHCGTSSTPLWRNGPLGPKSLCNACGIRFKKVGRRSPPVTAAWNHLQAQSGCEQQQHGFAGFLKSSDVNFHDQQQQQQQKPPSAIIQPRPSFHPQHEKPRVEATLPFAREFCSADQSPCSSNAVGSSCITWQDSMPSAVCVDQPPASHSHSHSQSSNPNLVDEARKVFVGAAASRHLPLVLDAEVIRSVAPVKPVNAVGDGQSKQEQGRFLRMSL